ncbi:MAG: hypothetical protein JWO36_5836 [Myxococcales bacterium]|nr:hypothetical protein [Myxococcales bacterium]
MTRPTVLLDLASDERFAKDLAAGGVFVIGCTLKLDQDCDLIVRALNDEVCVPARVVFVDPTRGAGLELEQCTPEIKDKIALLARTLLRANATSTVDALEAAAASARVRSRADKLTGNPMAAHPARAATNDFLGSRTRSTSTSPATAGGDIPRPRSGTAEPNPTNADRAPDAAPMAAGRDSLPGPTIPQNAVAAGRTRDASPDAVAAGRAPTALPGPTFTQHAVATGRDSLPGPTIPQNAVAAGRARPGMAHPTAPTATGDELAAAAARARGADRTPVKTITGDALAAAAAAALAGPDARRDLATPRAKVITGSPTITGDALAAAAAAALATAKAAGVLPARAREIAGPSTNSDDRVAAAAQTAGIPEHRAREITGPPTITGDALVEAARHAAAKAGPERQREVTGAPTITGDALAAAAAAARAAASAPAEPLGRQREVTGAPTITGDALAAAAAAARAAAQRTPAPTITGDALASAAAAALAAAEGDTETETETSEAASHATDQSDADDDLEAVRNIPATVHERLRGLTLAQQIKLAHHGEMHERIVLERMYGKSVWEALLRNPKVTGQEVARVARMGTLPRPQIETIVGNGTWLQIPEVRRALLANHRLSPDQVMRILRLLPKHELKLAAIQTAYPMAVRDAARRMMRGD